MIDSNEIYLQDFNQCVSMTDMALRHGCDIHNTVPCNSNIPNPLFLISNCLDLPDTYAPAHEEALIYFLKIGYDMEERNEQGLTLLLDLAMTLTPSVIKLPKILIKKGTEIHAVDIHGCGVLHHAFMGRLSDWNPIGSDFWENLGCGLCESIGDLMLWFKTYDERYAEDYDDLNHDPGPLVYNKQSMRHTHSHRLLSNIRNRDDVWGADYQLRSSMFNRHETSESNLLYGGCQANLNSCGQYLDDPAADDMFTADTDSANNFRDQFLIEESNASTETGAEADDLCCDSN